MKRQNRGGIKQNWVEIALTARGHAFPVILGGHDNTVAFMHERANAEAECRPDEGGPAHG